MYNPNLFDCKPKELIARFTVREEFLDLNAVPVCNEWPVKKSWDFSPPDEKNQFLDVGYFFCPYMPLTKIPTVVEENPVKGILTKYGAKLLREGARCYARLNISDYAI